MARPPATFNAMKVISVRQPWPWLMLRPDLTGTARADAISRGLLKDIENRSWSTNFRGRVLIHAGKSMTRDEYDDGMATAHYAGVVAKFPAFEELPRGGIVGAVTIVDCIPPARRFSMWHMGDQFGFQLADPRPLPLIPCRGALSFFNAPPDIESAIWALHAALAKQSSPEGTFS